MASTATGRPVSADTVFQIASMSKPLSSTIVSGLVGDGVIDWDEPIAESGRTDSLSDPWVSEHVTYADLFSHRSGLPGATAGNDLEAIGYDRSTILERLPQVPLDPFREQKSATPTGAMTLGGEAAAEAAADTSWEQLADDVLFEPAGMDDTSMRHADFLAADDRAELHVRTDDGVGRRRRASARPAGPRRRRQLHRASTWPDGCGCTWPPAALDGEPLIDAEALGDHLHPCHRHGGGPPPTDEQPPSSYGLGWNVGADTERSRRAEPLRCVLDGRVHCGQARPGRGRRDRRAHQRRADRCARGDRGRLSRVPHRRRGHDRLGGALGASA